jgi:hypothetical protein
VICWETRWYWTYKWTSFPTLSLISSNSGNYSRHLNGNIHNYIMCRIEWYGHLPPSLRWGAHRESPPMFRISHPVDIIPRKHIQILVLITFIICLNSALNKWSEVGFNVWVIGIFTSFWIQSRGQIQVLIRENSDLGALPSLLQEFARDQICISNFQNEVTKVELARRIFSEFEIASSPGSIKRRSLRSWNLHSLLYLASRLSITPAYDRNDIQNSSSYCETPVRLSHPHSSSQPTWRKFKQMNIDNNQSKLRTLGVNILSIIGNNNINQKYFLSELQSHHSRTHLTCQKWSEAMPQKVVLKKWASKKRTRLSIPFLHFISHSITSL